MNITKYELLLCAVKNNNITMAADEMNYSQPGATHMINSLETELGVRLLDRSRSGSRLTPEGKRLFPLIQAVVNNQKEILKEAEILKNQRIGKLTIGSYISSISIYMPKVFTQFAKENPESSIEFRVGTPWEVDQWIEKGTVELGIIMLPVITPKEIIPICQDQMVLACGKDYPCHFDPNRPVTEEDLKKEKILSIGKPGETYDMLRYYTNIPDTSFAVSVSDTNVQIDMAKANMGIAMTGRKVAESICDRVRIFEMEKDIKATVALVYRPNAQLSPLAEDLIRILRDSLESKTESDLFMA